MLLEPKKNNPNLFPLGVVFFVVFLTIIASLQLLLAVINPYNYFEITLVSIFYYIQFFACGAIALVIIHKKKPIYCEVKNTSINQVRNKNTWALIYSLPGGLVFLAMIIFIAVSGVGFQDVRDTFFYGDGSLLPIVFGEVFIYLNFYIGLGYYLLISYITRFKLLGNKGDQTSTAIIASALVLLDSATGGRMAVFYVSLILIVTSILFSKSQNLIFRGIKIKIVICLLLLIFTFITISRVGGDNSGLLEFFYKYMVGPVFLMSHGLTDAEGVASIPDLRFGMSFMSLDWVVIGLVKLAKYDFRTLFDLSNDILSYGYYLNNNYGINAHFTAPFYFAIDFWIFSGAGIFSYIILLAYLSNISKNKQRQVTLLVFLCFALILGIRENIFNSPAFLICILLLLLKPFKLVKNNARFSSHKY